MALLLVVGLFAGLLGLILLRRRRQPAAWPVPSLLGLEAARPEPLRLPEPESLLELTPALQDVEPAPVEVEAEAGEEASEEELELVA